MARSALLSAQRLFIGVTPMRNACHVVDRRSGSSVLPIQTPQCGPRREAMDRAGIPIPGLRARDGLAIINGSNLLAGMGCLQLLDAEKLLGHAEIACAMTLEALQANMKPYDERLHSLRGFPGAVTSARNIRRVIEGSDLLTGAVEIKVQDAYSMRSSPQVGTQRTDLISLNAPSRKPCRSMLMNHCGVTRNAVGDLWRQQCG